MTTDTPPPPSEAETVLSVLEAAVRLGAATEESQRINIGLRLATLAPAILRMIRRQPEAASAAAVPEGVKTFVGYSMRNNCKFFKVYPFDTWEAANAAAAAYLAAPPPPVDAVGEDVEQRVRDLVDFWFSPWGAAKGARWEEISGDKEFSAENMLRLIRDALQARPTPSGDAVAREAGDELAKKLHEWRQSTIDECLFAIAAIEPPADVVADGNDRHWSAALIEAETALGKLAQEGGANE